MNHAVLPAEGYASRVEGRAVFEVPVSELWRCLQRKPAEPPEPPLGVRVTGHSRREMTGKVIFASGIADLEFNDPFFVNLPVVLVNTMELEKAEVFEWLVEDKNPLVLRRTKPKPMRESQE